MAALALPLALPFHNVSYFLDNPRIRRMDPLLYFHPKQIIRNISAIEILKCVRSGKLEYTVAVVLKKTRFIMNHINSTGP